MQKAAREAKLRTSWIEPGRRLRSGAAALRRRAAGRRGGPQPFLDDLVAQAARLAWFGALNSLSTSLLKFTSPGVPDIYQGNEVVDLTLVDPDNRRPVDYPALSDRLAALERLDPADAGGLARDAPRRPRQALARLATARRAARAARALSRRRLPRPEGRRRPGRARRRVLAPPRRRAPGDDRRPPLRTAARRTGSGALRRRRLGRHGGRGRPGRRHATAQHRRRRDARRRRRPDPARRCVRPLSRRRRCSRSTEARASGARLRRSSPPPPRARRSRVELSISRLRHGEQPRGVDQRHVRQRLRKVAEQAAARADRISSDSRPTSLRSASSRSNSASASRMAAGHGEASASQKVQGRKAPSPGGRPSTPLAVE